MTSPQQSLAADFDPPSREQWMRLVEKALKGADFDRRLVSQTADGIRVEPLYTREMASANPVPTTIRRAGDGSGVAWEMCQLCQEVDPAAAARVLAEDVEAGATSVAVGIEAPGQAGIPATAEALEEALARVPLDRTTVSFAAGENAAAAATALAAVCDRRAVPAGSRRAALGVDPLGAWSRSGALGRPLQAALSEAAALAAEPRWRHGAVRVLLADGRPVHEAGGSEAQELGAMLASLVAYLRACEAAGLKPAVVLPRISIALAADADLFLTMAKLRAARLLVRQVASAVGAAGEVRLLVSTSERMMARRDPWVNLLRTCTAGMAAALGGADAISILPFTFALGRADAFARRIARNMHVVLAEESGLGRVADPAAGGWHVETLTTTLAQKGWAELQAIEAAGGMAAALGTGLVQDRVAAVAAARQRSIAIGRAALTGVSAFPLLAADGVTAEPHPAPRLAVGTHDRIRPLAPLRLAAPFEALRERADAAAARAGQVPRVFLASLGTQADHAARSTWIANFLAAGGIGALASEGYPSSTAVGRAFADSGATVACICSSDETYALLAEATAGALKQAGAGLVLLAGRPKDEAALRQAGVDDFLYAGQDAIATLERLHAALNIA